MAADLFVEVHGLKEAIERLRTLPKKLMRRAIMDSLRAAARPIQRQAQLLAPVLRLSTYSGASAVKRGVRAPGTVRRAIRVRTSRLARKNNAAGVFVNVRPLNRKVISRFKQATGRRGKDNPADPYYWRWLEFGTRRTRPFSFLRIASRGLQRSLSIFEQTIGPRITRLNYTPTAEP